MFNLFRLVDLVFDALTLSLIIRVFMSWVPHDRYHPVIEFLYKITDPMLKPFQNLIPPNKMGIDLSPILAFFSLGIIQRFIYFLF